MFKEPSGSVPAPVLLLAPQVRGKTFVVLEGILDNGEDPPVLWIDARK